jgi:hypothetical protein
MIVEVWRDEILRSKVRGVWLNGKRVTGDIPAARDASRWIGFTGNLCVKVDRWKDNQCEWEFTRWQEVFHKSDYVDALAAVKWFTEIDGYGIVIQERIKDPVSGYKSPLSVRNKAYEVAEVLGIGDFDMRQYKLTDASPFGFKIHDYGL